MHIFDILKKEKIKYYIVGGTVRDEYLGKQSKDLDILVTGIPAEQLSGMLKKYGKVDMVGASFGVIKFTPPGGEEVDIAIPRTEKKSGAGYQGFEVTADHNLPIEMDLGRRDFTINSIAKDLEGNIIDPFNGLADIRDGLIRVTNPIAFSDDPLRMLRAIQFSTRFEFKIEPTTLKLIKDNAHKIKEITMERVLIEFQKIVDKGNPRYGAILLVVTGLYKQIFPSNFNNKASLRPFNYVKKMSEFIYFLIKHITPSPSEYYKKVMKGDIKTTAEIKALELLFSKNDRTLLEDKWMVFNINKIAPSMLESYFVTNALSRVISDFKRDADVYLPTKGYPISYKQMMVNGTDFENVGLKKEEIGKALKIAMDGIYSDEVLNAHKSSLIQYVINKL